MKVIRFKSRSHEEDTLRKLKKMKQFINDLEECFEDEDDVEYRSPRYRDEDYEDEHRSRYDYRRGGRMY